MLRLGIQVAPQAEGGIDEASDTPGERDTTRSGTSPGEELPSYRDHDAHQAVSEPHDTFAEMTAALDVDVTPQTVRTYMIEHGIHEPTSSPASQLSATSSSEVAAASTRTDTASADESADASVTLTAETAKPADGESAMEAAPSSDGPRDGDQGGDAALDTTERRTLDRGD